MEGNENVWENPDRTIDVPYNKNGRFVNVEFPGVVQNVEKALQTLGGIDTISKTYSTATKRLPLTWRPDDQYAKPAFGDRTNTTNLLMKVQRKKSLDGTYKYRVEVVGVVDISYQFKAMADFQFLPMQKKDDGQYESLLNKLTFKDQINYQEYCNRDVPLFIPPVIFSRNDMPGDYLFRKEVQHRQNYMDPSKTRADNLIGTVRQKRTVFTIFINFEDNVPLEPIKRAREELQDKFSAAQENEVIELFKKRPIWSKAGLLSQFSGHKDRLKFILPLLSFYYLTGPWRCMWCRFGYSPRENPQAKIYQTIDFRVRHALFSAEVVKCKRSTFTYNLPTAINRFQSQVARINISRLDDTNDDSDENKKSVTDETRELTYIFRPDKLPPHRQMFYQLCDIHLTEVEDLLHENDGQEEVCDEKDGWCVKDMGEKCRTIMAKYFNRLVEKEQEKNALEKEKRSRRKPDLESDDSLSELGGETELDGEVEDDMDTELLDCA
ncbi:hypothetical protein ScPMuIL_011154 [Solemya velum]